MQQVSQKTLTFLLVIAIVVSVTGTMISIKRINQLVSETPVLTATGMAGSGSGMVNVTIAAVTSITALDSVIAFGSCSPPSDNFGCNTTSNDTFGCSCDGGGPDNITISNDGNKDVNVSVKASSLAKTFIGGTVGGAGQAEMWFAVRNGSTNPGCGNASTTIMDAEITGTGMQYTWKNISIADDNYQACANLTYGATTNTMSFFAKLFIPANAPATGGEEASTTLTFTATSW